MPLLTDDIQEKLIALLVDEGLVASNVIQTAQQHAAQTKKPLFGILTEQAIE